MIQMFFDLLTAVHFISIGGLALYGFHRIWMIWCWYNRTRVTINPDRSWHPSLPLVTVQIPLYNESLVAARIIDAVAVFDWPEDRLQIQVLDDSTDGTCQIVKERVAYWSGLGKDIYTVHRTQRTGYKAGALGEGLRQATGEFIAVFDADFFPKPDFLKQTIVYFNRPDIGLVQARWGFLNTGYSWVTRLQSLLLSAHFSIEHAVRHSRGLFFNFNGTAGIWRKSAIDNSGGWSSDTVTEDLDLSYRAQIAGWRFVYVDHIVVPSELPVTLSDFRRQQERWVKGAIQTGVKLLPGIAHSALPLRIKLEAAAHLLANFCWIFGFLATLTLYPMLMHRVGIGIHEILWFDLPLFLLTGVAVVAYYMIFGLWKGLGRHIGTIFLLPALSIGLAPYFSLAVIKGLLFKGGVFRRTPKFGITANQVGTCHPVYHSHVLLNLGINLPLLMYSLVPVSFAWQRGTWPAIPFLCFFPLGFAFVIAHDGVELVKGLLNDRRICNAR